MDEFFLNDSKPYACYTQLSCESLWVNVLFNCKNYEDIFPLCCINFKEFLHLNNRKTQFKSYQNYKVSSFFLSDHSPLVDWQCLSDMHYIHLTIETEDQSSPLSDWCLNTFRIRFRVLWKYRPSIWVCLIYRTANIV